jgi:hypothetical protein
MEVTDLLSAHVDRFNSAVVSGIFDEMVAHFSDDAVMTFEGMPAGPFRGREEIAGAYRAQPPDDGPDSLEVSYAWSIAPDHRAGTMMIERRGDLITRLVVRFE